MTDWKKHLEAQAHSGLTAAEYCRREKLICSQFLYWRSKQQSQQQPAKFVAIGGKGSTKFKIMIKEGIAIEVPADFEAASLKRLLEVVGA